MCRRIRSVSISLIPEVLKVLTLFLPVLYVQSFVVLLFTLNNSIWALELVTTDYMMTDYVWVSLVIYISKCYSIFFCADLLKSGGFITRNDPTLARSSGIQRRIECANEDRGQLASRHSTTRRGARKQASSHSVAPLVKHITNAHIIHRGMGQPHCSRKPHRLFSVVVDCFVLIDFPYGSGLPVAVTVWWLNSQFLR